MILFSERLKYLRKKNNMTQQQLANLLGVSKSTISGYETGSCKPTIERLIRLADIFNVTLDFFYLNFETSYAEYIDGVRVPVISCIPSGTDIKQALSNPADNIPVTILYYRFISSKYQKDYKDYFIYEENNFSHTVHITSDIHIGDTILACIGENNAGIYFCKENSGVLAVTDCLGNIQPGNISVIGIISETHIIE